MQRIYVLSGMPGIGKSTWAKRLIEIYKAQDLNIHYISRDEVRFELVSMEEEYFSKEKMVFDNFMYRVNECAATGEDIIIDATHLNKASRRKMLSRLKYNKKTAKLILVIFPFNLNLAIERNEKRQGTRAYVPVPALRKMARAIDKPGKDEGFNEFWHINQHGNVRIKEVIK